MSTPHLQIKSNDVLQLILQYLHQNKLFKSYNILSEQANLTLNQINKKDFIEAFNKQNWSQILISVESLMLTPQILFNLYQFICDSLIQRQQFVAASFLIQQLILANIKDISPFRERLLRLEYIIQHPNQKNLYKNPPNEQRMLSVLNKVLQKCCQTQPQRLLKLLSQAIKYQVSQGVINPTIKIDMFTGLQEQIKSEAQTTIKQVEKTIQYNQQSKITALKLSWNDEILAIGGVDGLIELYNTKDYALCDTEYQRQGVMLFHQNPISLMEFNYQDQMLASVDSQALVNIWNLKNGKLLRKIDKEERINAICWGIDPSHFLVGYQDRIKLYGVRSCNLLKQYSTNKQEYLQKIMVSDSRLYALSSNCTFKMFNYATQEQLFSLELKQSLTSSFCIFKNDATHIFKSLIVSGKNKIYEFDQNGIEKAKYIVDDGEIQNCCSVGYFIYINVKGVDNKYRLSVLDRQKKKTVYYVSVQSPFQQMAITRRRNLMITYDQSHKLSFWRP